MKSLIPLEIETSGARLEQIYGYLSVKSQGGTSVLDIYKFPSKSTPFHADGSDVAQALAVIERSGLQVVAQSRLGISVVGPAASYEQLTGGKIVTKELLVYAEAGTRRYVTHLDIVGPDQPAAIGCGRPLPSVPGIEAVIIERPRSPQASIVWPGITAMTTQPSGGIWPSPIPPTVPGFYLRVPQDVALGLGVPGAQQQGFRGQNVTVAMVDTGHYLHPFFTAHHYKVKPAISVVSGVSQTSEPVGHGTGESANLFAAAPDVQLQPIRASDNGGQLIATMAGFLKAKELKPQILTNSWGGDQSFPPDSGVLSPPDAAMALEIKDAVEQDIFVVFSAGNGQFSIEAQIPEVFAAGGVYMSSNMALQASNYSSGYRSPFFADRTVPDSCGLVGLLPRAAYIMLPVPPGCEIDVGEGRPDEHGHAADGTLFNDGWALFSGTSAAAPQIAGVAAVLLSAKPNLKPAEIKEALNNTCVDVTSGWCHPRFNNPARPGPDQATGFGLVHAVEALKYVQNHF